MASVTATLGVIPTETIVLGHRRGRFAQAGHVWLLQSREVVAADQQAVDLALQTVMEPLEGKDEAMAGLAGGWEWHLIVSAHSDSSQGGFVVLPQTLLRAGQLGLVLMCSVYVDQDDQTDD